ncbi:unnamed protein product [Rotaria sordida]|uniref:Uncharacterized protein n=1 Tax=Rotaria sordida TaxID=392033 RepID=A0A815C1T3_9BILA|nr:unnamed protein product [Rotaria sordida]CAF1040527.1 unnamed protein product [Rotaria sordida]CAF1089935.1 unnamed protein product [Rotaria sordida]CAF1277701.1 unnamed protein product [Rotaria sordida]CAF3584211.1 unnamed protein product [Rotaria sordida]
MKVYCISLILLFFSLLGIISSQSETINDEQQLINEGRILPALVTIVPRLVAALGPRVYLFVTCMGADFTLQCGQKMLDCSTRGKAPWDCIGGLTCSGKSALKCARTAG